MRETIHIHLNSADVTAETAYRLDGEAAGRVEFAALEQVLELCAGRRVLVYVPAEQVRLELVTLPIRQAAKLRRAVPYALEDHLAEDIDELHFAIGNRLTDGGNTVCIVARDQMQQWLSLFSSRGLRPDALFPEPLCLPCTAGEWTLLLDAHRAIARTGAGSGFACPTAMLEQYLLLAQAPADISLRMHLVDGTSDDFSGLKFPVELMPGYASVLDFLIDSARTSSPMNLLQGEYSQRESIRRYWRPWVLPAGLAAAWFLVVLLVAGQDARRTNNEAQRLEQANVERFRALFPADQRIVNIRAQLDQKLAGQGGDEGGSSLLPLMAVVAQALPAAPGLSLQTAQFQGGALYLNLKGDDLQSLEKLRSWFSERADSALEVQTANAGSDGVQIRVKVSLT